MVEVIYGGTRIPYLMQKAKTIDVDVQEELCSVRDPLPYLDRQSKFATALASAYNDRLAENRLKLPSRKRCHPPYTTGRSSRCMCSLSK